MMNATDLEALKTALSTGAKKTWMSGASHNDTCMASAHGNCTTGDDAACISDSDCLGAPTDCKSAVEFFTSGCAKGCKKAQFELLRAQLVAVNSTAFGNCTFHAPERRA